MLLKCKYLLFDLDGTLIDSRVGIIESVKYCLAKLGLNYPNDKYLEHFIGPPLKETFMDLFKLSEKESNEATKIFRDYYSGKGIFLNEVYEGIPELLTSLHKSGVELFVATSKPTIFAEMILEENNLLHFFKAVVGSNLDNSRSKKEEIIGHILSSFNIIDLSSTFMIGDKSQDIIGAKKMKIKSIGLTYGYGSREELEQNNPEAILNSPIEILNYIIHNNV